MSEPFVHLHVHSHYSLLDGAAKVPDLIQRAVEFKMPALALTDHGNLFGALEFYQQAKKAGIKPIVGYEAYISNTSRQERDRQAKYHHITLLAKDYEGYKNLMKLASEAYLTGFYYKPRIDKDILASHSKGLIALSGCLVSEVCRNLIDNKMDKARDAVAFYKDLFPGDFYIELQQNHIEEQQKANEGLLKLAREFQLPMVFTNDIHYLKKEDSVPHEVLLCIQTGTTMQDQNRFRFGSDQFYMKSPDEMYEEAKDFENAAKNTLEIAEKVNLNIPAGENHIPPFKAPDNKNNEQYLYELCENGLKERYGAISPEIKNRFEHEYKVICKMGFASYFLIVWDFINYARSQGISVGPGRGSAAGSIVSYALKITNLDPIQYHLIFERFLNEGRYEMPDIDIDFETIRRGEVIDYVTKKYGEKQVVQIITFGTLAARAAIRDVGRALNIPLSDVDRIAKKVPTGLKITLEKGLEEDPEFKSLYDTDATARQIIDIAIRLEGLNRQPGTHAAGVIIADDDVTNYCPLYKSADGTVSTQYSMDHMVNLGLLKMDFLGLSTLTLIEKALFFIKEFRKEDLNIDKIPLDDIKTYNMLSKGETKGVFQLESDGMKELVRKLKPDRFEDIIALVALYRPGPLGSGMVDTYCRCKHGMEQPVYKHPILEKILSETYGIILYQEQAMRIASDLSGFSLSEADKLRKAMGKKKKDLMQSYRVKFIEGAKKIHNVDEQVSAETFDLIDYFSGYGFNKSHSAAYALVAYQTAYLKAHYTMEFMAALMTIESQNTEKVVRYIHECEIMHIPILGPDINLSESYFLPTKEGIRFGFSAIKGVGEKAVDSIIAGRKKAKKFTSLFHLCQEVDTRVVNKQVLEALAKSGAMDVFGRHRKELCETIPTALQMGGNIQKQKQSNQMTLFDFGDDDSSQESSNEDWDRLYAKVTPWNDKEKLNIEKETLGFFFSSHPLKQWGPYLEMLCSHTIANLNPNITAPLLLGGMISEAKEITIKNGKKNQGRKMAHLKLEDRTGICHVTCFPDAYELNKDLFQVDQVVFIQGKIDAKEKEEAKVLADHVMDLDKAFQKLSKSIVFQLNESQEKVMDDLKKIFALYPGQCRTLLEIQKEGFKTLLEVSQKLFLCPSQLLLQETEKLLGKNKIFFTKELRGVIQ
ncbi:MAG: DNA polymerase III subunit alpha [Candidatus Brocadiae bacterium]|nr:DNA polymerase III subunit alpha [Candidatus Brocadiia bacterium]